MSPIHDPKQPTLIIQLTKRLIPQYKARGETDQPVFGPDITTDPVLPKNGNVFAMVVPGTGLLLAAQVFGDL